MVFLMSERVRESYSANAELYIDLFGTRERVHDDDLAFIGRHLGRPGKVLDVGCGPGHLTEYLHSLGADATGIDLVPEFIAHARAAHPHIPFHLGSMDDHDVPVDGILSWYSLIHRNPDDVDAVLAQFRRMLNPSGTLVVGFFPGEEIAPFEHKVVTAYFWPVDELSSRLSRAGFTEVDRLRRPADGRTRAHAVIAAR
jgi:trans-aconitate methyltransferase